MAKKKKKATRRRRRVGAMAMTASSPLVTYGSIALGFLAGTQVNSLINGLIPATLKVKPGTGKMVAIGQAGAGAALIFLKGKKSMIKTVAGGLLLGSGIKRAMVVFKAGTTDTLGGYGDVPVIGYAANGQLGRRVAGYGDVPVIGSYGANSALNGKVVGSVNKDSSIGKLVG